MSKQEKIIEMKQKRDLNGLVKIIKNADEWMLRLDAAKALAQLGDKRGLNYLIHTLDDPDANIRDEAREILEGLNDPRGNQALLQHWKPDIVQSEYDNNSTSHAIEKGIIKKAARSQIKRKPKNNDSYLRTVLIIIVIAGILIFIDSFSWSKGGMNGLSSMIIVSLAVLIIGSMYFERKVHSLFQPKQAKIIMFIAFMIFLILCLIFGIGPLDFLI